jgi:hypothetical protein
MAALASAARSNLALTLLSTAPLGTPVTIPAPTAATAPASGSYCGAASAASFLSISAGAAAGLEVKPPLAPCLSPGAAPPAGLPAPPAPAVTLTASAATALAGLLPAGARISLSVVQNGLSPRSETAGLSKLTYPALPALSDLAIRAQTAAATAAAAAAGTRPRSRALQLLSSVLSTINAAIASASGGKTSAQASQGDFLAANPRPTTSSDLLPSRPMDSRVVSLSVLGAPGAGEVTLASNVTVVVPLRDTSTVTFNAARGTAGPPNVGQGAFLSPVINITCPTSPAAARRGITAQYISGLPASTSPSVTLQSATQVGFTGVVGATVQTAAVGGGAVAIGGEESASVDTLSGGAPPTVSSSSSRTSISSIP